MNFGQYVGSPWQERGCWELLRRVYIEQLGISLPTYADQYDPGTGAALIEAESRAWTPIARGDEQPGDAARFTVAGQPSHVGVVVGGGRFLHIRMHQTAVIESYRSPLWSRRLDGFFRHAEAC